MTTREQLIKALRDWDNTTPEQNRRDMLAAADMLEADGVPVGQVRMLNGEPTPDDNNVIFSYGHNAYCDTLGDEEWVKVYTAPQPSIQERKPLTDEQIDALALDEDGLQNSHLEFARAIEAALSAKQGEQEALLDSTVTPHALYYPLSDYHRAPAEGPLNFTWIDKPHRLLYDLIAAVKFYANPAPSVNAQESEIVLSRESFLMMGQRISELEAQNAQMLGALKDVAGTNLEGADGMAMYYIFEALKHKARAAIAAVESLK